MMSIYSLPDICCSGERRRGQARSRALIQRFKKAFAVKTMDNGEVGRQATKECLSAPESPEMPARNLPVSSSNVETKKRLQYVNQTAYRVTGFCNTWKTLSLDGPSEMSLGVEASLRSSRAASSRHCCANRDIELS